MRNKKLLTLLTIVAVCALTFVACAPAADEQAVETPPPAEQPGEAPASTPMPEEPAPVPEEDALPDLTGTDAAVTLTTIGEITEIRDGDDQIRVVGTNDANPANDIVANITDDTIIIDAQTSKIVDDDNAFVVGATVSVTVSSAMTRSQPPVSNAYMAVVNVPENMQGLPEYVIADEVAINEDGSVTVLTQNKDLYITISGDLDITAMEDDGDPVAMDVNVLELKKNDVLLVWYDAVALSYPAQTTATDAVLIVDVD